MKVENVFCQESLNTEKLEFITTVSFLLLLQGWWNLAVDRSLRTFNEEC